MYNGAGIYKNGGIYNIGGGGGGGGGDDTVTIGDRTYKTVKIGNFFIWLAENLEYKFQGLDIATDISELDFTIPQAFYYNFDSTNKDGLLYNSEAVKYMSQHSQDLFPNPDTDKWDLPGDYDFDDLINEASSLGDPGTVLKSTSGWYNNANGTDNLGFNAKPVGAMINEQFSPLDSDRFTMITSLKDIGEDQTAILLGFSTVNVTRVTSTVIGNYAPAACSVRLVRYL